MAGDRVGRARARAGVQAVAVPMPVHAPAAAVTLAGGTRPPLPVRLAGVLGALLAREVEDRRGALFLPVGFALGIALYLGAAAEPSPYAGPAAFLVLLGLALALRARPFAFHALALAASVAAGFGLASLQVQRMAHPVLAAPLAGVTVSGTVEQAELRPRGSRIVLKVSGFDRPPKVVPQRVRIALATASPPPVGTHVSLRADLAPPPGPAYPGGFDFGRAAWFEGIGATGYAVGKWRETPAPEPMGLGLAFSAWLEASRQAMAARIRAVLPGEAGGVAVALVTGIRGQVPEPLEEAMRVSGLSHILSISGLHMALVATTVFFLARALLALWPGLALTRPIKAWAAVPALLAATYYLLLSGAEVATQRSYVMTLLVLCGVMLGRPALTLHTLALAALIVLTLAPWALLDPGAQMSFAATLALVVVYERGGRRLLAAGTGRVPWYASGPTRWLAALALTSLAAGLATAPYAAYHFQRLAPLSLIANLAATPLVSFVIMPAGLVGTLAMPFGWEGPAFRVMGWGIDAMNAVARWVASLPGADGGVRAMPLASLVLITFAFLAACLLRTRLALVAAVLAFAAGGPILAARPPDVLIDAQARTVAVRGPDGQLVLMGDRRKGLAERFAAEQWFSAEGMRGKGAGTRAGAEAKASGVGGTGAKTAGTGGTGVGVTGAKAAGGGVTGAEMSAARATGAASSTEAFAPTNVRQTASIAKPASIGITTESATIAMAPAGTSPGDAPTKNTMFGSLPAKNTPAKSEAVRSEAAGGGNAGSETAGGETDSRATARREAASGTVAGATSGLPLSSAARSEPASGTVAGTASGLPLSSAAGSGAAGGTVPGASSGLPLTSAARSGAASGTVAGAASGLRLLPAARSEAASGTVAGGASSTLPLSSTAGNRAASGTVAGAASGLPLLPAAGSGAASGTVPGAASALPLPSVAGPTTVSPAQALPVGVARCDALGCVLPARDGRLVAYPLDPAALVDDCRRAALVLSRFTAPADCAAEVIQLGRAGEGAGIALRLDPEGVWQRIDARPADGTRPWLPGW
ncbi:ComEC/Rec2 family competence protein [Ancylobacter sp. Lp-2]|uniref:ComEC/Rec2 family competence protein n=1 Tax=Ancylobacter sp. Lp-2 TaxID=2881339 RepID=UPI001E3F2A0A|nr:ComEC/Rec2 family competence protein [Ancylobacter sp. Lp-2]MCB4771545.1 ComEC/Rec2 family competence protein [Ancylobacter sp. Lp-2]